MKTVEVLAMLLDEWPTCYEISFIGGHWHFIRLSVSDNEYPRLPTDIVDSSDCGVKVNEEEWKSFKQDIFYDCEILNPFKFKTPLMALAGYLHKWPEEVISIRYIGGVFYVKDAEGEGRAYPGENLELAGFVNLVDDGRELTKEDWSSFKRKCITYHIEERKFKEEQEKHKLKKTTLQFLADNLDKWPFVSTLAINDVGILQYQVFTVGVRDNDDGISALIGDIQKSFDGFPVVSDPGALVTESEWLAAKGQHPNLLPCTDAGRVDVLYNAKLSCLNAILVSEGFKDKDKAVEIAEAINAAFDAIK